MRRNNTRQLARQASCGLAVLIAILVTPDGWSLEEAPVQMTVTRNRGQWSYELINHTSHSISVVSLLVEAPFKVTASPVGWAVQADGCSTVTWISKDKEKPYPHDIQPGASLGGFTIRSAAKTSVNGKYSIQLWDETNEHAGKAFEGDILVPSVPEGNCAHD